MLFNLFKLLFHMVFLLGLSLCFALFFCEVFLVLDYVK